MSSLQNSLCNVKVQPYAFYTGGTLCPVHAASTPIDSLFSVLSCGIMSHIAPRCQLSWPKCFYDRPQPCWMSYKISPPSLIISWYICWSNIMVTVVVRFYRLFSDHISIKYCVVNAFRGTDVTRSKHRTSHARIWCVISVDFTNVSKRVVGLPHV